MDPIVARGLARLRARDGAALRALAVLVVDEAIATPVAQIAAPRWIASQIAAGLESVARGDVARTWVDRQIAQSREAWRDDPRKLRTWMPAEADKPLRQVLSRNWNPDPDLTMRILDQPAVHRLVAEVLEDSLLRFQKRVKNLDKTGLASMGVRAAKTSRGLFGGMTRTFAPEMHDLAKNLTGIAGGVMGAVTEEIEAAVADRIKEYVTSASADALRVAAAHLADPRYAKGFGELRISVLDVLLDTSVSKLAAEGDKLKPEELVDVVIGALRSALDAPDFVDRTEERVAAVMARAGDGTFGAWLDEVGLRAVWTEATVELVHQRLVAVAQTEGFGAWFESLFAE